jgi:hypothetical protein
MFRRSLPTALAAFVFVMLLGLVPYTFADPPVITAVCHATSSAENPYNFLRLPPEPLSAHFDEFGNPLNGHEQDFFPVDNDCNRLNDPGGGDPPPGAVPEPITILLFGAGVAGVGYASRRFRRKRSAKIENEN